MPILVQVPHAHVEHLLEQALRARRITGEAADAWRAKLRVKDAGVEAEIRGLLDDWEDGTVDRLNEAWTFYAQRAVHLWKLVYLPADASTDRLLARHAGHVDAWRGGAWHNVTSKKTAENARVRRVQVSDTELLAEVRIWLPIRWMCEGTEREEERTSEVTVRVVTGKGAPLAEVYASQRASRIAIFAVVDWLRGKLTPRTKSVAQAAVVEMVRFTEADILRHATRLGLGQPTEVAGDDPMDEVGHIKLVGKRQGPMLAPLDVTSPKVQLQVTQAENDARRYNIPYTHDDGFKENADTSFHFRGTAHLTFHARTSRPAIDSIIAELRATLGV